jgi:hypothetical protein
MHRKEISWCRDGKHEDILMFGCKNEDMTDFGEMQATGA